MKDFLGWISKVHGPDVAKKVACRAGRKCSREELSVILEKVLEQERVHGNNMERTSEHEPLTFDNDLTIP